MRESQIRVVMLVLEQRPPRYAGAGRVRSIAEAKKTQTGRECSEEARALDEEFAITAMFAVCIRVASIFFSCSPHVLERKVPLQGTRCAAPAAFTKP